METCSGVTELNGATSKRLSLRLMSWVVQQQFPAIGELAVELLICQIAQYSQCHTISFLSLIFNKHFCHWQLDSDSPNPARSPPKDLAINVWPRFAKNTFTSVPIWLLLQQKHVNLVVKYIHGKAKKIILFEVPTMHFCSEKSRTI